MKKTLLTISDGNGVENDFHKWPFLLKILTTKTLNIVNQSVVGSSNEMMFYRLAEAVQTQKIDYAIIQWSLPQRVDVIVNDFWQEQAKIDPVYHFNLIDTFDKKWWVTSISKNTYIQEYHLRYINTYQARLRSDSIIIAAAELLKFHNINYTFSLCYSFPFTQPFNTILEQYPWAWHSPNNGINEFRQTSQYLKFDKALPQPHPLIGLEWINQVLKPNCNFIDYDDKMYYNVEQHLLKNV